MSKIKNGGLDQYGAKPFEQQQFGTAGVEGINTESIAGRQDEVSGYCAILAWHCICSTHIIVTLALRRHAARATAEVV